jgi:2-dehydro-3-deoxyphosphogluconate aldolase/(4S)-4-hydroxy-2-oxoglutarate aldolase
MNARFGWEAKVGEICATLPAEMPSRARNVADRIRGEGLIAIARGDFRLEEICGMAQALKDASASIMEVTLDSPRALEAISALRERYGNDMSIGAGTVLSADDVSRAVDAGAEFLVSPGLDPASITRARELGAFLIPGVLTASEILAALREGLSTVKLFPSEPLGPAYLRALRAPFPDVEFIPTGGISVSNARGYFEWGAVAVGVGSTLLAPGAVPEEVTGMARRFLAIASESRCG